MLKAIVKRLASSLLSLLILVALVFAATHFTPGGPAYSILGQKATPASIAALNARLGLNQSLVHQFVIWVWHLLHGNLGYSYLLNAPVEKVMLVFERNTIVLYLLVTILSLLFSIILGLIHGVYRSRLIGNAVGAYQLIFYAMPGFFLAPVLIIIFSVQLGWLPASGIVDLRNPNPPLWSYIVHLILPTTVMTLLGTAGLSRYFAASVREELAKDYVRTALAKGVSFRSVLYGHVLRNALRPLVTLMGLSLPGIFTGGIIVESIFGYPGLGWLMWRSALTQDYPILIGIVLVIGILTVLGNLLADLINSLMDPRASYE